MKQRKCPGCGFENPPAGDDISAFCERCNWPLHGMGDAETSPTEAFVQHPESGSANGDVGAFGGDQAAVNPPGAAHETLNGYGLEWPWGAMLIGERLFIGRVPPATEELATRIEGSFPNVSRMHGEVFVETGQLYVRDLGSMNGTFINSRPAERFARLPLRPGDRLRFGATLEAIVTQHVH